MFYVVCLLASEWRRSHSTVFGQAALGVVPDLVWIMGSSHPLETTDAGQPYPPECLTAGAGLDCMTSC